MDLEGLLRKLTEEDGVSGYEKKVAGLAAEAFSPYIDETRKPYFSEKRAGGITAPFAYLRSYG